MEDRTTAQEDKIKKKYNRHYIIWNKNISFFLYTACKVAALKC